MPNRSALIRFLLLFLIARSTVLHSNTPESFNSIRIACFHSNLANDSLITRIARNNYNYAVAGFVFRPSNDSVGDGDVYANLRADVCSLCVRLDKFNIRLIPLIPMSSKWALQWKILQEFENPLIGMNTITADDNLPAILGDNPLCEFADRTDSVTLGCNSWAFEPEGVDKSMTDVFRAVRNGFADAHTEYPLEYIHIQHDEPQFLNWLLMAGAGAPCGTAAPYRGNFARGEVSHADGAFIQTLLDSGVAAEEAYQRLLADELHRRIVQAEEVFGPDIKLLFYGESFDDQSWGGVEWRVNLDENARILMDNVITLPGLDESRKEKVREKLIPVLWNYDGKIAAVSSFLGWLNRKDYKSEEVFARFAEHGFRFIYTGALQNGDASLNQIGEYATAAQKFRKNCLGYYSAAWDVPYNDTAPDPKWDILEYLPSVQLNTTGVVLRNASSSSGVGLAVSTTSPSSGITVSFTLLHRESVEITIFTPDGKLVDTVLNRRLRTGRHTFHWKKPAGFYLVRFVHGNTGIIRTVSVVQ